MFLFAATGEWVAERAGTLNISVEGMLLAGAFGAALGTYWVAWGGVLGVLVGCAAGLAVAVVQANLSHRLTANQFVVGLALNVLVLGLTAYLDTVIDLPRAQAPAWRIPSSPNCRSSARRCSPGRGRRTSSTSSCRRCGGSCTGPAGDSRRGPSASGRRPPTSRASTSTPGAARPSYLCGLTSGFGGAFLVLGQVNQFQPNVVNGRGFIAIAAVIFGGWTLRGTVLGCILFGFVEALTIAIPVQGYEIDPFILDAAPYVVALAVMLLFATRVRQPRALAQPFIRGLT